MPQPAGTDTPLVDWNTVTGSETGAVDLFLLHSIPIYRNDVSFHCSFATAQ